jgi:hypothetical protein
VLPNVLGSIVATQGFRESIGNLMWVILCGFHEIIHIFKEYKHLPIGYLLLVL